MLPGLLDIRLLNFQSYSLVLGRTCQHFRDVRAAEDATFFSWCVLQAAGGSNQFWFSGLWPVAIPLILSE